MVMYSLANTDTFCLEMGRNEDYRLLSLQNWKTCLLTCFCEWTHFHGTLLITVGYVLISLLQSQRMLNFWLKPVSYVFQCGDHVFRHLRIRRRLVRRPVWPTPWHYFYFRFGPRHLEILEVVIESLVQWSCCPSCCPSHCGHIVLQGLSVLKDKYLLIQSIRKYCSTNL